MSMQHTDDPGDGAVPGSALDWAARALGVETRAIEIGWERDREWSRVRRLDLPSGQRAWLKELPEGLRHEVAIVEALASLGSGGSAGSPAGPVAPTGLSAPAGAGAPPAHAVSAGPVAATRRAAPTESSAPALLAADRERGWILTQDGGPSLFEALGDGEDDEGARVAGPWELALVHYARLQRAATPLVPGLLAAGVPDLRPLALPALAARLVAEHAPDLERLLSGWEADARTLEDSGIEPSLQHEDLHSNNVFERSLAVFDWGDATIAHPWMSLSVAIQEPWERRAQAAYLAEFDVPAHPEAVLASARRLGCVSRAASWARVGASVGLPARFGNPVAEWLARGEDW